MSYTFDSPRESTMHKLLLTLVLFSSGVLCNEEQNLTDAIPWSLFPTPVTKSHAGHAIADFVPSIVSMNGSVNYQAAQQVFFMNGMSDMFHKGTKECKTHLQRDDYVVTAGIGAHKLHKTVTSWNEARKTCMAEGGTLAIINSVEEEKMLMLWMAKQSIYLTWLGVHDLFEEGEWVTLTGETLKAAGYDVWEKDEPNNTDDNEHCGILVNTGEMNDIPCDKMLPFFCESKLC